MLYSESKHIQPNNQTHSQTMSTTKGLQGATNQRNIYNERHTVVAARLKASRPSEYNAWNLFAYRSHRTVVIAKQSCLKGDVSHRESWSRSPESYRSIRIHKTAKYSTRFSTPVLAPLLQLEMRLVSANPYVLYSQVGYFAAKVAVSQYVITSGVQNCPCIPTKRSRAGTAIPLHLDEPLNETQKYAV